MSIEVQCPTCGAVLPAPDEFAGKKIRCADCEGIVHVPAPKRVEPSPPDVETIPIARVAEARSAKRKEWDDEDRPPRAGVLRGGALAWLFFLGLFSAAGAGILVWALLPLDARP